MEYIKKIVIDDFQDYNESELATGRICLKSELENKSK